MCDLFTISFGFGSIFTAIKDCIFGKASYIWDLEDNLDALNKALQDLTQAKEDVNTRIAIAEQHQTRRRLKQVELWLTRVQDVETQADELLRVKSQEIEKLCLGGYCSRNPKSSCEFGKKLVNLLKALQDLTQATFVDVAERIPEDPVDERPSEPTVGLDSKFDQVWSYISDKQVKIIGLYGKGGVGKTTLLTQINNKFLSFPNDFVVIWVLVSKGRRLESIQETIMKKIEAHTSEIVRMHDVIRDMALWIACEVEEEKFLVCSGIGLTRAPEIREWENVKRMSLMKNKIENLSEIPNCPELLTLFLQRNPLKMLTSGFFGHMIHLKVLNLSRNHNLTELPVGISELVELQHLDLSFTGILELPKELKALTNLKCLNLEHTDSLRKFPRHVISNLSMLQVLRMYRCGSFESKDSILFDEGELFMEELVCLEHLNVLSINFKNSHTLGRCLSCPVLQNCAVESVSIQLNDGSTSLNVLSLGVLKDLGELHIRSTDLAELVIDREMRNVPQFYSLHCVELFYCSKLRDATWLVFAPNLKILWIYGCDEMKEIISVEGEVGEMMGNQLPFPRLQFLTLVYLPKLESIYCNPLPFPHLKGIQIFQCPKLKKLPLGSNSIMTSRSLTNIRGEEDWWNELQWEDQTTQDHFLPFLEAYSYPLK
ncbi:hypothetical protein EZV62_003507 [Acer yangbiense]|uniref:Uncharacterized protein n=1 Tax=Acer yangbiense TaxID=1000413 RepID=A0A5C7IIT0_9ROSI|nr:hypothetical protein EZV62_003507 [Acer yangbiense]